MGGLFGKPNIISVDAINNVINESVLKLASTTESGTNITQYMEAGEGATVSGNTQYADVRSNTSAVLNATQTSGFNAALKNEIVQDLQKKTTALLGALDGLTQNNNVKMTTNIGNNVGNLNLTEITPVCTNNNTITQSIVAKRGATITNNSQTVKADFIQSCIGNVENSMEAVSDITNSINQRATLVAENPLDFLSDIAKSWMMMILLIVVALIVGVVVLIGPGKVDANALISQGLAMTPPGRIAAVTQAIAPTPAHMPLAITAPAL